MVHLDALDGAATDAVVIWIFCQLILFDYFYLNNLNLTTMKNNYLRLLLAKSALLAVLFTGQSRAQDTYIVEPIAHQAYATSMDVLSTNDDFFSEVIDIPFDFKFFWKYLQ